ncbi:MAG: LytS/YhcK type 5TM receptor domain-containing protein [Negativicutes bacterium]
MEDSLSMILIQRIAFIAVVAYVFSQTQAFRFVYKEHTSYKEKTVLTLIFSAISIAGTYLGIPIEGAIANVRDMGSIVAGLLGGPLVGIATGLISGIHRISMGGFTALQCGIATILGGILAGYIHSKMKPKNPDWITGVITGVGVIIFSMLLILAFSKPFESAFSLVAQVIIPMSLANALGIGVFMIIVQNAKEHQTRIAALQTHRALRIANAALPYFRQGGLTAWSAQKVATTILMMTSAAAVAITDCKQVLAHAGLGNDHHCPGGPPLTAVTKSCLSSGSMMVAQTAAEIGCNHADCPLKSAVIVPLFCRDDIAGTLKIYYAAEDAMTSLDNEFAQGLGQLFSTQLELANLQQKAELATVAELNALRAQINPHFLFNALNTIVSLCRTDSEQARNLIIELSEFFRRSLKSSRDFITLQEELQQVDSYLTLEKARFGDRLSIIKKIDAKVENIQIPSFTLQPLVENAVKHGLLSRAHGGTITISAEQAGSVVEIQVEDDGQGIPKDDMNQIFEHGFGKGAGVGLTNVNERLKNIYGQQYALRIDSVEGKGTIIYVTIPLHSKDGVA